MSIQNMVLLAMNVFALSVGQVLFKLAARALEGTAPLLERVVFNKYLFAALVVYALATGLWVALLREVPLSVAYPFVALAFFLVPLMGHWVLGETLRWQTLAGAAVIVAGVWVCTLE
jgi:drug/metabolite transporter (DMT)-like permease